VGGGQKSFSPTGRVLSSMVEPNRLFRAVPRTCVPSRRRRLLRRGLSKALKLSIRNAVCPAWSSHRDVSADLWFFDQGRCVCVRVCRGESLLHPNSGTRGEMTSRSERENRTSKNNVVRFFNRTFCTVKKNRPRVLMDERAIWIPSRVKRENNFS